MVAQEYDQLVGMSYGEAEKAINHEFKRSELHDKNVDTILDRHSIFHPQDPSKFLGLMKETQKIIPYAEVMSYLKNEFDSSGIRYKITDSIMDKNGGMYQTYVFESNQKGPDGSAVSPMAIVRSNIFWDPLNIQFGTYRFVCMNGVTAGKTVSSIRIPKSKSQDLLRTSLTSGIALAFDKFEKEVFPGYEAIGQIDFQLKLQELLNSESIQNGFKRKALVGLLSENKIDLNGQSIKQILEEPAGWRVTKNNLNGWDLYNSLTRYATHETNSISARLRMYEQISEAFGV